MPYIINEDFRLGVDRRRSRIAGTPGSLWVCENAHITRGGEIQKRKKFVEKWTLPPNTFGLKVSNGTGYVFGSQSAAAVTPLLPVGVTYQQLSSPSPSSPAMTAVLDVTMFDGAPYVVAEYSDGNVHHFYNTQRVTAMDDGRVLSFTTSLDEIATRIATLINISPNEIATANAVGSVITITGKSVNVNLNITAEAENGGTVDDQAVAVSITQAATTLLPEICTVTLSGTLDIGDRFAVSIKDNEYGAGGNPSRPPTRVLTHDSKVYGVVDEFIYFSAVDSATIWRPDTVGSPGAGVINASTREEGALDLLALGKYQAGLAFFDDNATQVWTFDPDPAQNRLSETLPNTGAVAGGAVTTYGNNDTFYLSLSGVRSLRARDSSNASFVSDVGNAIDSLLIDVMLDLGSAVVAKAKSIIEPIDGRFWLAIGSGADTTIYVLSHFPGGRIMAWTWYKPGFTVDAFSVDAGRVYVRSGDKVYVYGGDNGVTYDADENDNYVVTVSLPFLSTKRVAHDKVITGYEVACTNEWLVELLVDARNENRKVTLGRISESTYPNRIYPASAEGSHFAPVLTCSEPGPATITNLAIHVETDEPEIDQ